MPRVFLAYKTVDGERASVVRAKLEALAVPLFIDQKLVSGDNYLQAINEELNSAVAVLVLWSAAAVRMPGPGETNFVLSEAQKGYSRNVLVAATFEKMALDHLPVPFNLFQAPDLSDWISTGASAKHREWQKVLEALARKLNRPGLPSLAVAVESADDALKRKFLVDYPNDPHAPQIAEQIEAFERKEFETHFSAAKKRIQQRVRDAEKRLKSCRDDFEAQVVELRAGRNFMAPDPVEAIGDKIGVLENEIEIYVKRIDEEQERVDRAEGLAAQANVEAAELKSELSAKAAALNTKDATIERLNAELAARDRQIIGHQSTTASHATELAAITESAAATRQELEGKDARTGELQGLVTELKQQLHGEAKRRVVWVGIAALTAAGIFAFIGRSMAPQNADVQALNAQIASLARDNQTLHAQAADAAAQTTDLNTQKSQLKTQQDALATDKATVGQQQKALAADKATLDQAQKALATDKVTFDSQQKALAAARVTYDQQQKALAADKAAFDQQQRAFAADKALLDQQQKAFTAAKTTGDKLQAVIPLVAQCDALAGYQYDPDRPSANGWTLTINDIPGAQAICRSALQAPGIDQITQRRLLLGLARTYVESSPVDYKAYLDNLNQASRLGSSQADYQLGMYYAAQNNPQLAWDKIQRSAAAHNPVALNRAAISQIFPDWNEHFITGRSLDSGFQYLQQALDAAYYRSYYVAGAAYWTFKERDTPDRSRAIYYLTVSQCVTDKRDPSTDREGSDYRDGADYYYLRKTGKHLACP
jgi:cell division protein FtsB